MVKNKKNSKKVSTKQIAEERFVYSEPKKVKPT